MKNTMTTMAVRNGSTFRKAKTLIKGAGLGAAMVLMGCAPAFAQTATADAASGKTLLIELNKLAPHGNACRVYMLFNNKTTNRFSNLTLDIVVFDKKGIINKELALDAAPLTPNRLSVKIFDIDGTGCDQIGKLLLNNVTSCKDQTGTRTNCLGQISLSARGSVPFVE